MVVQMIQQSGGWSMIRRLKNFDPFKDLSRGTVKVLQICAAVQHDLDNIQMYDNTHCVSIVDGLVFDPNKKHPLPLSKKTLDLCCVGGETFVFHHVSLAYEFIPGNRFKKYMSRLKK